MSLLKAVFVWCIWLGLFELSFGGRIRKYKFDVEYTYKKPDCVEHVVIGINGQFPGPTITAEVGDTLVIELTNKLATEGTVIHWHGIRQVIKFLYFFHSVVIDAEIDKENHGSITRNCDREGAEIT
jgi:hypothetical protein